MNNAFTPPGGFGFAPFGREDRRAMFRQMRAQAHAAREQGLDPNCQTGFGFGFNPRGGFGFDPRGGAGFGPFGGPFGGRGRGGRRGRRGDVRAAILTLLTERPMHGYEMTQEIAARTNNLWKPSPGSVYPTLQLLVDEGLIEPTETEGSKKTFDLTAEGRQAAAKIETPPWSQIVADQEDEAPAHQNLHAALSQLMAAVGQSAYAAGEDQQQRILDVINNARREIYTILGEE
ncbi:DNA-binding PadR family transcriptional regulator [Mycobacterium frederiksbergense]|uniref:DNA-binding PadR family transcriptional regulator n=1 Tax=Mycolicibacterium frederiksbergense TaxID=117567 RepID=A0ABT6L1J9_9MYCO|nr:PadR family transcriptional regulator [Mycolicibacterium frederiksbergense]MDH6196471.1 DNA-binding PadR family transcriptional regulator [Mycolicibacterium frederiksbergense]